MSMAGYTKLFSSILASTVWREPKEVRVVWITLLAMADRFGVVDASVPGLADLARVTVEECDEAILALSSPDPRSRSKEHNGRRILERDGGWRIVNYLKYRELGRNEDRRDYFREVKREQRKMSSLSTNVHTIPPIAEAEAEADKQKQKKEITLPKAAALAEAEFDQLWKVCAKKVGKAKAQATYLHLRKAGKMPEYEVVIAALESLQATDQWTKDNRQFQPHLMTWLNRGGWDDELPAGESKKAPVGEGACNRCGGKGYVETPIPGTYRGEELGSDMRRDPCSRCQSTGRF